MLHVYVAGTALFASAAVALAALVAGDRALPRPWLLVCFVALLALERLLMVRLSRGRQGESVGAEETLLVLMLLTLSPFAALVGFVVGVALGEVAVRRPPLKGAFNVAQLAGSAALAVAVVAAAAPGGGTSGGRVLAALAGVFLFALANNLLVAGVLAFAAGLPLREGLLDGLAGSAAVWAGSVSVGTLAGLSAAAHPWALPFAVAAASVLAQSLLGHAQARRDRQAYGDLLESSAAAIFSVDAGGRVGSWNPQMESMTGRPAGEASGRSLHELARFADETGTLNDLLTTPAPHGRLHVRMETRDGAERWLTLSRGDLPNGGHVFVALDVSEQLEAERSARESEARLRLALDAGGMGTWEWDFASGRVRWSENLERIFGLEPGGFGGSYDDFLACVHPDDREGAELAVKRALEEGRADFSYRGIMRDGTVRCYEGKAVLALAGGEPKALIGVASDITERKRVEALAELQSRALEKVAADEPLPEALDFLLRLVEDHTGDEVLGSVMLLDEEDGRLRHGAAPGLPPGYVGALDAVGVGLGAGSCGSAAASGETVVVEDIATDPRWAPIRDLALRYGLHSCWSLPICNAADEVIGTLSLYARTPRTPSPDELELAQVAGRIAGVAIQRSRQHGQLVEAEERYRRLVERLPLAIYTFTPVEGSETLSAHHDYLSPQFVELFGYPQELWLTDTDMFTRVVHPDDRERVRADVARARATASRFRGEYRLVASDGRVVWVHDACNYLRAESGRITAVEGYLVDVSERKALENDLLQAQKLEAVGRLAGGVAHDFNNMMSAVVGFSELVLAKLDADHPARPQVEEIKRAGERASEMTGQLLAFGRKQMLQPRALDLNESVRETEALLRQLVGDDIALVSVLDPALAPVKADRIQLEQVLLNLVVNARDAMPVGGRVTIETGNVELGDEYAAAHADVAPGSYALLAVTDTGVGMDTQTQERIFEPFFTTKPPGEGTGLGLATVFGVVKQSGGHVAAYSEPGHGTTFKVYLPYAAAGAVASVAPAAAGGPLGGRETILLVDDEEPIRRLERETLEAQGYTVLEARSVEHALETALAHTRPIDLLLTDVVMPGLSGPDLAKRLTKLRPDLRVLYTSGYADEAIVRHGVLDAGAAFLPKPLSPSMLCRKVREVLDDAALTTAPAS